MNTLSVVVPCYNEEAVLEETHKHLEKLLTDLIKEGKISQKSFILFVDDGSTDSTWDIIKKTAAESKFVSAIRLAANSGHQNALFAGLMTAKEKSDAVISVDADLQDDISVIGEMLDKYKNGSDIVYGVRKSRKSDSFYKRNSALLFYKFMNIMGAKTVYNHADFRLMSKRALDELENYGERNLFLRGIVPLIGYKTDYVYYDRLERVAGESKYSTKKMLKFALDGITSFSVRPMYFISGLGTVMVFLSIAAAIYSLVSYLSGNAVAGWTSMILSLWFIGGMILLSIGIVGQYIGKIYIEVKNRPRYNIEEYI